MKVLLALFDSLLQSVIVALAADGALNLVGGIASRTGPASEEVSGGAQERASRADDRGLKTREIAVAAFVAVELKLITLIRRKVFVVVYELDERHAVVSPESSSMSG
jgi:hypothetical protein